MEIRVGTSMWCGSRLFCCDPWAPSKKCGYRSYVGGGHGRGERGFGWSEFGECNNRNGQSWRIFWVEKSRMKAKKFRPTTSWTTLNPRYCAVRVRVQYQTHGAAGAEGVSFGIIFDPYPRDRILDFSRTSTNCSSSHGIKPSSSAGTVYSVKILFDRNPMHTAGVFCFRIYSWRHLQYRYSLATAVVLVSGERLILGTHNDCAFVWYYQGWGRTQCTVTHVLILVMEFRMEAPFGWKVSCLVNKKQQ